MGKNSDMWRKEGWSSKQEEQHRQWRGSGTQWSNKDMVNSMLSENSLFIQSHGDWKIRGCMQAYWEGY